MRPTAAVSQYFQTFVARFGQGWNRFWFIPSDPATLGLVRLCTGLVALYSHLAYTVDLQLWFGPNGLFPVSLSQSIQGDGAFSLLDYAETSGALWAMHYVGFAVLLAFAVGLFSRVTSVLALVVVLSYFHRGPMVTGYLEPLLAMVMFYLCLGPSGAAFSIDAWRKKQANPNEPVKKTMWATLAVRLIQVHLTLAYLMMALSKLNGQGDAWWNGEAAWMLMARADSRLVDLTHLLAEHPLMVNFWTHSIVLFEILFGVFIWNRLARPLLLALAFPYWLSLALITGQTTYCVMMLVANLAFFSPEFIRACCDRSAVAPTRA